MSNPFGTEVQQDKDSHVREMAAEVAVPVSEKLSSALPFVKIEVGPSGSLNLQEKGSKTWEREDTSRLGELLAGADLTPEAWKQIISGIGKYIVPESIHGKKQNDKDYYDWQRIAQQEEEQNRINISNGRESRSEFHFQLWQVIAKNVGKAVATELTKSLSGQEAKEELSDKTREQELLERDRKFKETKDAELEIAKRSATQLLADSQAVASELESKQALKQKIEDEINTSCQSAWNLLCQPLDAGQTEAPIIFKQGVCKTEKKGGFMGFKTVENHRFSNDVLSEIDSQVVQHLSATGNYQQFLELGQKLGFSTPAEIVTALSEVINRQLELDLATNYKDIFKNQITVINNVIKNVLGDQQQMLLDELKVDEILKGDPEGGRRFLKSYVAKLCLLGLAQGKNLWSIFGKGNEKYSYPTAIKRPDKPETILNAFKKQTKSSSPDFKEASEAVGQLEGKRERLDGQRYNEEEKIRRIPNEISEHKRKTESEISAMPGRRRERRNLLEEEVIKILFPSARDSRDCGTASGTGWTGVPPPLSNEIYLSLVQNLPALANNRDFFIDLLQSIFMNLKEGDRERTREWATKAAKLVVDSMVHLEGHNSSNPSPQQQFIDWYRNSVYPKRTS